MIYTFIISYVFPAIQRQVCKSCSSMSAWDDPYDGTYTKWNCIEMRDLEYSIQTILFIVLYPVFYLVTATTPWDLAYGDQ